MSIPPQPTAPIPPEFSGGPWPTSNQLLLLKSALSERDVALTAWKEWKRLVDFDEIGGASQKLLPLVYHHLSSFNIDEPLLGRMKGHYRLTWYRNQQLFHRVAPILQALADAGIPMLALKGPALAVLAYQDLGLRPMADFDIIVPYERAVDAISLLQSLHWQAKLGWNDRLTPEYLSVTNGFSFENGDGQAIDLHWFLLPECCYAGVDDDMWQHAMPMEVSGVPISALRPTAQLMHICLHGYKWNPVPPMRWVADALTVMRVFASQIDWDELVELASRRNLNWALLQTLRYLSEVMAEPVPEPALRALRALPVSSRQRREYEAFTNPLSPGGLAAIHWARHTRATSGSGRVRAALGFPDYVRRGLGLDHVWQAPGVLIQQTRFRLEKQGRRTSGGENR